MKFLRYFFLLLFVLIWLAGLSPYFNNLADQAGLLRDSYRFGDLYRLSNLPDFKDPRKSCAAFKPVADYGTRKPVHLYIIGDSFTEKERINETNFAADQYHYVHWSEVLHFKPDTSAIHVLLLESVERHFREKFAARPLSNIVPDSATYAVAGKPSVMQTLDQAFKSEPTEGRLDQLLFQNDLILSLKQLKAKFNFDIFDRTNKEVTLVNNNRDIVYYMDTDTPETTSSFTPVTNAEIDSIVLHLNETGKAMAQLGFSKVLLSVIPNKVSVLSPDYGTYNHLIEKVYANPRLELAYIDVLQDFRKLGVSSYLKGDSHWTCEGQNLWLEKTNRKIAEVLHP
ncbi:hypothetical protein DYBT9275_02984 [Dyadobacter sp. CECT 9275]|uniref:AlgX/AlgJ SGNH hydrolase-like domain-containing protein n=1 Tax=Dyadobacter helix TaxID=2822344 RepID=A0A916JD47_9BACT|nr:hypothetical protein [Dyadobacter sp. CECT 9275]CAG5002869.1 hypothetical protein DYBT9275_02984 [Dyadobacter sp. CECT 9275]